MNDDSDDAVVGKKKNPDTADDIGMASENTASGQSSLTGVDHDSTITDHYETLGLGRYASISDVRRAYRRLAARLHPDRNCSGDVEQNKGTSDAFCAVSAAYEILGEESRKDAYDAQLRHSVLGNTSANAHEDSLEAIRRDRERVKEMSRVNRVPLSAYAPGDAVLKQMREAIRHEGQHHTSHHPPASTAIHPFCPSQSEHFHESRSFITQNAVEELIRQRHQQDAERRELLADIDRLHAEAEQERERRRREREEKKKTLSWMLQSDHQQGTVSKKCPMSSTADAAHTDESVLGFDKRAWLHTHDSSPSTAKHLSDETHEKQRFDSMDDTTLSILLPKTGLRALPEKGISTDEESGHPLCVDCVLIPADEKLQKMYRDDPHNAHVELTRLENVMKHKLSVITSLLR